MSLPTVSVPVKGSPLISAVLTPVIVYGIVVPVSTFAAVSVIVNDSPSPKLVLVLASE